MRPVLFFAALVASGAAFAADNIPPADEAAAIAELRAAADAANAHDAQRWAFTLAYEDLTAKGGKTFKVRFDPRLAPGARWKAIEPAESALSKDERKALKKMSENDDADEALVYDDLDEAIGDAALLSLSGGDALFRISIDDPEMTQDMRAALVATARLDRAGDHVSSIEVRSTKPFKPAAIAKIEKMRQLQRYAPVGPGGVVLLVASESEAEGKAMFKSFSSKTRIAYSDFEAVDAPPRAKAE